MKKPILALLGTLLCGVVAPATDQPKFPPLPVAVSDNAVASLKNGLELYSLMGIGPKKNWNDITNHVYVLRLSSAKWTEVREVPGVAGRLGASAVGTRGQIFLFGGYVVDAQGNEIIVSDVNAFSPSGQRWYRGADIPLPVANAIIGVSRDRFIYLVGGRSKNGPVNNVQIYDAEKNTWSDGTPFPGTPVFGQGGGVAEDTIVFVDGAMKNAAGTPAYVVSQECWVGKINKKEPEKIEWSKLPAHPGPAHFGIAAGSSPKDRRIVFSGGSAVPFDFKGLNQDGKQAEISRVSFAFDIHGNRWETVSDNTVDARIGERVVLETPVGHVMLGGMSKDGAVTERVLLLPKK